MKQQDLINILLNRGYIKKGYGYCKGTKEINHWVTFLGNSLQVYGLNKEIEKEYDTGIIKTPTMVEFTILIDIFNENHI